MYYAINKATKEYFVAVNPDDYDLSDWVVVDDVSTIQTIPIEYWKVSGNNIVEMTQSEKDAVDALNLDFHKQEKCENIDTRTRELIAEGFTHSGVNFSLSQNAQRNWMVNARELDLGHLTFPMNYPTNDDGLYSIADATEFNTIYYAALSIIQGHVVDGATLKVQVKSAVDKAGIDAIVDNR